VNNNRPLQFSVNINLCFVIFEAKIVNGE